MVTNNFFACWPSGPPCQPGALRIHLTRLSTEGLGPRHGEVRRAHQMLNAALSTAVARSSCGGVARPCTSGFMDDAILAQLFSWSYALSCFDCFVYFFTCSEARVFDCICRHVYSLQCFDSVCWASGRAFDLWKLSDEVWCGYLSGASCRLLAYGPANAHPRNPSSLASSRLLLPFWYRPTQVVREEAVKQV